MYSAFMALAWLALALNIAVPQGVMPVANALGGVQMVICTGEGPLQLAGRDAAKQTPDAKRHNLPCTFAGHGIDLGAPSVLTVSAASFVAYTPLAHPAPRVLAPGRGLAAPPLPARGPPILSI